MEYKKLDEYIGNELYKARVVKRITQVQIVNTINKKLEKNGLSITRQAYSYYEHGMYSIPQGVFQIACKELGLDWKEVFSEAVEYMKKEVDNANL